MAKTKFLKDKKTRDKEIGGVLVKSGARGISFLGAQAVSTKVFPKVPGLNKLPAKAHGPILFVLGLAGEALIDDNDNLLNKGLIGVSQGLSTYGMVRGASDFLPDSMKSAIGLSGIEEIGATANPAFWSNLLDQSNGDQKVLSGAEEESNMQGLEGAEEEGVNGLGAAQTERAAAVLNL